MANIDDLRDALETLQQRVEALEAGTSTQSTDSPLGESEDTFWALNELRSQLNPADETADGLVMMVGSLSIADGPVEWQQAAATAPMIESDWSDHATPLAALGHPVRLELLRQILTGTHSTADLAQVEGLGTTGQLHHHLRQLLSSGWLRQAGRGTYQVPAGRIVPLLTIVMGAER